MTDRQTDTFIIHIRMCIYTFEQVKEIYHVTWDMIIDWIILQLTKFEMGVWVKELDFPENLWFFQDKKFFFLIWEISYRINNQYIEYGTLKWVNIFKLVCKVQFLFARSYVIIRSNYATNSCKYTYIIKWYNYRK